MIFYSTCNEFQHKKFTLVFSESFMQLQIDMLKVLVMMMYAKKKKFTLYIISLHLSTISAWPGRCQNHSVLLICFC